MLLVDANVHPVAGVVGAGQPPFVQVLDCMSDQLRPIPSRAAPCEINSGYQKIHRIIHYEIQSNEQEYTAPANRPQISSVFPEKHPAKDRENSRNGPAGSAGNNNAASSSQSGQGDFALPPPKIQ